MNQPVVPAGFGPTSTDIQSRLAPAQMAVLFTLQPETLPVFCAWLRQTHDISWTDAEIREDLDDSFRYLANMLDKKARA
jgi:hypothetical protein